MPNYPGTQNTDDNLYVGVNNLSTVLTDDPLSAGAVTVNVSDASNFPTVGILTIDLEAIHYTGTTATTFTGCTRGFDGTTGASHPLNTTVFHDIPAAHHNVLKDEVKAVSDDLRDGFTADLNDAVVATNTAVDNKERLDMIVTQIKNATGEADWKTTPANTIAGLETQQNINETTIAALAEPTLLDFFASTVNPARINFTMGSNVGQGSITLYDNAGKAINFKGTQGVDIFVTDSGVNGLDTGSEASNTWYHYYAISNGTLLRGLMSVSSTAPTMPSGYTFKRLLGSFRNDSGSNFRNARQNGSRVEYLPSTPNLFAETDTNANVNVNRDASGLVPPTAVLMRVNCQVSATYSVAGQKSISMLVGRAFNGLGNGPITLLGIAYYQNAHLVQGNGWAELECEQSQQIVSHFFSTSASRTAYTHQLNVIGYTVNIGA